MNDPWAVNAVLLASRKVVFIDPGALWSDTGVEVSRVEAVPKTHLATLLKNLEHLGHALSAELLEGLANATERQLVVFHRRLGSMIAKSLGAHVRFEPMYRGFPAEVMEASEAELYFNAWMHYLGDLIGRRLMPDSVERERGPLAFTRPPTVVGRATLADAVKLASELSAARTSTSETDKSNLQTLLGFLAKSRVDLAALIPAEMPHKENLAFFAGAMMALADAGHETAAVALDVLVTRHFKTAVDVLRLAVARSGGDVSLAAASKFTRFSRKERRLLLAMIERCTRPLEDMIRHRERWLRLGERLHPGEHRGQFPLAAAAFDVLRRSPGEVRTAASAVEEALRQGDVMAAVRLLTKRPGELARRLDHLLRIAGPGSDAGGRVIAEFERVAPSVSTAVLLQVLAHMRGRAAGVEPRFRAFFPKGQAARLVTIDDSRPGLETAEATHVAQACRDALRRRFKDLAPMGRVFVDERLKDYLVPFSQRSASKALRTLVRGSALPLPPGGTIRFFMWWKEGEVGGKPTGRVDLDLSATMYDAAWTFKSHIAYTFLRQLGIGAHSGDITSAPDGACEFIDIDLAAALERGMRYLMPVVLSFSRHPFHALPECFAGWMMRDKPQSGQVFEPSTVLDRVDLTGSQRVCVPAVIDLLHRRVHWVDLSMPHILDAQINVESNKRGLAHLGRAMVSLVKPTLYDLFVLHAEARGERVFERDQADIVIAPDGDLTPFDVTTIMSAYL